MANIGQLIQPDTTYYLNEALQNQIRSNLKDKMMKFAEAEIDLIVDETLQQFKTRIETYRDREFMTDVVRVLVKKESF